MTMDTSPFDHMVMPAMVVFISSRVLELDFGLTVLWV